MTIAQIHRLRSVRASAGKTKSRAGDRKILFLHVVEVIDQMGGLAGQCPRRGGVESDRQTAGIAIDGDGAEIPRRDTRSAETGVGDVTAVD